MGTILVIQSTYADARRTSGMLYRWWRYQSLGEVHVRPSMARGRRLAIEAAAAAGRTEARISALRTA